MGRRRVEGGIDVGGCVAVVLAVVIGVVAGTIAGGSCAARAGAQEPAGLPGMLETAGQWTPGAKLALARALWGEAGIHATYARRDGRRFGSVVTCDAEDAGECFANRDWRIIPFALARRWAALRRHGMDRSFEAHVRAYSSVLRLHTPEREAVARRSGDPAELAQSRRRALIGSVRYDGSNLSALHRVFGLGAPFVVYDEGWRALIGVVDAWGRGEIDDESEGATDWDSRGRRPSPGLRRVELGETLNAYYVAVALDSDPE